MGGFSLHRRLSVLLFALILTVSLIALPGGAFAGFAASTGTTAGFVTGTFPTYQQSVVDNAPLGYYRLDDAVGTTLLADSSGRSNPAQVVNAAQYYRQTPSPAASTPAGASLALPGAAAKGYLSSADPISFSSNNASTFEVWFRTTATTPGVLVELTTVAQGTSTTVDRVLSITGGGLVQFTVMGQTLTYNTPVNDGAWHYAHGVVSSAPSTLRLYVDGLQRASTTLTNTPTLTSGYIRAGGNGDGTWFAGNLDNIAVYPSELTSVQINSRRNGGAPSSTADYTTAVRANSAWAFWALDDTPAGPWGQRDYDYPVKLADSGAQNHPAIARSLPPNVGVLGQTPALGGSSAGTSMRMDGAGWGYSTQAITVPASFTSELWFRTTSTSGGVLSVFTNQAGATCHQSGSGYQCGRMMFMTNDGYVKFGIMPVNDLLHVTSKQPLNDGQWHYAVATIVVPPTGTTAELRLYIDNELQATASVNRPNSFTGHFAFGGGGLPYQSNFAWPSSASFNGQLDEVAFYGSTLSQTTMSEHWVARSRT